MTKLVGVSFMLAVFAWSPALAEDTPPMNIAVVSLLDNTFHNIHRGSNGLDNTDESRDVSAWRVPEQSETDMVALLKQKGVGQSVAVLSQTTRAKTTDDGVEDKLSAAARAAGFDTLVVIRPTRYLNAFFLEPGYGLLASGRFTDPPPTCPYGVFIVEVYRTSDADRIDWRWGFATFGDGPCVGLRSVPWQNVMANYSEQDWATIEAAIHKRINDGMARAIDGLDFQ